MGLTKPSLVLSYLKTIRVILKCSVTEMFLNTVDKGNRFKLSINALYLYVYSQYLKNCKLEKKITNCYFLLLFCEK